MGTVSLPKRNPNIFNNQNVLSPNRYVSVFCIIVTLYGAGTVFIVLIAQLFSSIFNVWAGVNLSLCLWMVLVAALLIPLTWMGTPKDFW